MLLALFIGCTTVEEGEDRGGSGRLIRDGYPNEINPFEILKRTATEGLKPEKHATILAEDVDDGYPLRLAGSSYAYVISIKASAKHYTEEEYLISLRTLTIDFKECGEAKEFTFYRIGEDNGVAEYRTYKKKGDPFIFFAQKEMPSYEEWYRVLKVCLTEEDRRWRLEGVVL